MCPQSPLNRQKTVAFQARQLQLPLIGQVGRMGSRIAQFGMVSALVIGVMCGFAPQASAQDGQIILASLTTNTPSDRKTQPELFGASEQQFSDISAFTKWTGVLARFKKEFHASVDKKHVQDWMKFVASVKNKSKNEQIKAVNNYMNRVAFVPDQKNYNVTDYWATPMEFLARGGDCEDYAFAKYVTLRALGFAQDDLRLAIVYDSEMRMPHAILVVYHDGEAKILDNQSEEVKSSSKIERYKPIYSISQVAWWRH